METFGNLAETPKPKEKKWEVFLTVEDLSQMLQLSRIFIYKLVREKRIPFYHIEKCVRFCPKEIQEWIAERRCRELRMPRKLGRLPEEKS
jgi:excisionase family DNA binding protein